MSVLIIGIDPGRTTGICTLFANSQDVHLGKWTVDLGQVSPGLVLPTLKGLLSEYWKIAVWVAVEQFVVTRPDSRSNDAEASRVARRLISEIQNTCDELVTSDVRMRIRTASVAKAWATDERLTKAGIWQKGMRHAMDASRHALFCAREDLHTPDPLSRKAAPKIVSYDHPYDAIGE